MDLNPSLSHRKQLSLAQLAQDTIYVDGGQTQRIAKYGLTERTRELGFHGLPYQAQPLGQLQEELRRALDGVAPPDAD